MRRPALTVCSITIARILRALKLPVLGHHSPKPEAVSPPPVACPGAAPGVEDASRNVGHILSAWIIAPLVFLFLLRDTGEIKRGLLNAVPNRLFEPALRVLEDLDRALGSYLRGLFKECVLLGLL